MKNLRNLGTVLSKSQQKMISGGTDNDVFQHEGDGCYTIQSYINGGWAKETVCG